jgi:TetR/AcrR family transcriptional regulator, fatty acid metabolism regulator protein
LREIRSGWRLWGSSDLDWPVFGGGSSANEWDLIQGEGVAAAKGMVEKVKGDRGHGTSTEEAIDPHHNRTPEKRVNSRARQGARGPTNSAVSQPGRARQTQAQNGQVRERGPANKYEAILRAAIKVFAQGGFFNSKVADVAREAGVADGTVYLYFKNKDDILVSIFNHVVNEALEKGRARLQDVSDPIEMVRKIVAAHLELFASDRDLAIVFQAELRSSTKFMEQFSATGVTKYLDLIRAAIQEGQSRGLLRKELNSTLLAKILFGSLDEMVTNWVLSKKKYSLVATGEVILDVFFNGIAVKQ